MRVKYSYKIFPRIVSPHTQNWLSKVVFPVMVSRTYLDFHKSMPTVALSDIFQFV